MFSQYDVVSTSLSPSPKLWGSLENQQPDNWTAIAARNSRLAGRTDSTHSPERTLYTHLEKTISNNCLTSQLPKAVIQVGANRLATTGKKAQSAFITAHTFLETWKDRPVCETVHIPRKHLGRPWPRISGWPQALGQQELKAKAELSTSIEGLLQLGTGRALLQIPRGLWVLFPGWPLGWPRRDSSGPKWQKVQIIQNSSRKATEQRQQSLIKPCVMKGREILGF